MKYFIKNIMPPSLIRYRCKTNQERKIALSFDDGPKPISTEAVLDVLEKHNVSATFFVLGKMVERHPNLSRRIVDQGHEIASHGYSHTRCTELSFRELRNEIELTDSIIENTTGVQSCLFRPPFGSMSISLIYYLMLKGSKSVTLWSQLIENEWQYDNEEELIEKFGGLNIVAGDIILLHDVYTTTSSALPSILNLVKDAGLSCTTISKLI